MCAHCIYLSDTFDLNAVLFAPFQFILIFGKNKGVRVCTEDIFLSHILTVDICTHCIVFKHIAA